MTAAPAPQAIRLPHATVHIAAAKKAVGFRDLIDAGFTPAEIAEHNEEADAIIGLRFWAGLHDAAAAAAALAFIVGVPLFLSGLVS